MLRLSASFFSLVSGPSSGGARMYQIRLRKASSGSAPNPIGIVLWPVSFISEMSSARDDLPGPADA